MLLGCVVEYACPVSVDDHGIIKLTQYYDGHGMGKGILEPETGFDSPISSRAQVVNSVTHPVRCEVVR